MLIPKYMTFYITIHPNRNFWDPPVHIIHELTSYGWRDREDSSHPYYTEEQSRANLAEQIKSRGKVCGPLEEVTPMTKSL
jgi:hypothetical protein